MIKVLKGTKIVNYGKVRPDKILHYLEIARIISLRSCCTRRRFGAIIVKGDAIISAGYNGSCRGSLNCGIEVTCLKNAKKEESYKSYQYCPAVHGEMNAIINAARNGISVLGGTIYVSEASGLNSDRPCHLCRRLMINAGLKDCYQLDSEGNLSHETLEDWVKIEDEWMRKQLEDDDNQSV